MILRFTPAMPMRAAVNVPESQTGKDLRTCVLPLAEKNCLRLPRILGRVYGDLDGIVLALGLRGLGRGPLALPVGISVI